MNTAIQNNQSFNLGVQTELRRIKAWVAQPGSFISRLSQEAEISAQRVNTVNFSVEERMREFEAKINEIKPYNMNVAVPLNVVNLSTYSPLLAPQSYLPVTLLSKPQAGR